MYDDVSVTINPSIYLPQIYQKWGLDFRKLKFTEAARRRATTERRQRDRHRRPKAASTPSNTTQYGGPTTSNTYLGLKLHLTRSLISNQSPPPDLTQSNP